MQILSPAFAQNQMIPPKYTCGGEGINPPFELKDIPPNTKSLVLIGDDPDAPAGTFTHWLLWNLNPQETKIPERSVPQGSMQGTNSGGRIGYYPPCPPSGTHRYIFRVYALDTELELGSNINKTQLEQAIQGHILEQAELIGLYGRS